jgi:hypothetical protein
MSRTRLLRMLLLKLQHMSGSHISDRLRLAGSSNANGNCFGRVWVHKFWPDGRVRQATCVERRQGTRWARVTLLAHNFYRLLQSSSSPVYSLHRTLSTFMTVSVRDMETQTPRKKPRTDNDTTASGHDHSLGLFAPFRALGLVTNHVPFTLQTRSYKGASDGPRTHILTCLGRSWALWEGEKMTLLFAGA